MLYLYYGTDRDTARAKLNAAVELAGAGTDVFRITDAHTLADLEAALMGGGMFGGARTVVLDSTLTHDEMRGIVLDRLPSLKAASDTYYIYETAVDAATKKQIEKYAESSEKFESVKAKARDS